MVCISSGVVSESRPVPYEWHWTDGVTSESGEGEFSALWNQDVWQGTLYPTPVILELKGDGASQVEILIYESS